MIEEIIDLINCGFDGMHQDQVVVGLTQRVYRVNKDESIDYLPGIVKPDGEIIYAGIDDINSLMIYHKSTAAVLTSPVRSGYGDGKMNEDNFSFSLIASWDTRKIPFQSVDMMFLLRSRMPQEVRDIKGISLITINPVGALLNTKQIFESEYSFDDKYLLPAYINLIQLNYNVLFKYDPQCIYKCICKN